MRAGAQPDCGARGRLRRQIDRDDPLVVDVELGADVGRESEHDLAPVGPRAEIEEIAIEGCCDRGQIGRERARETQGQTIARTPAVDLDRCGPLEHQAPEARVRRRPNRNPLGGAAAPLATGAESPEGKGGDQPAQRGRKRPCGRR